MAARFCDKDPCPPLRWAFEILLQHQADNTFKVVVTPSSDKYPPQLVPFEYCPFCGTRIEPEWVETLKRRPS